MLKIANLVKLGKPNFTGRAFSTNAEGTLNAEIKLLDAVTVDDFLTVYTAILRQRLFSLLNIHVCPF